MRNTIQPNPHTTMRTINSVRNMASPSSAGSQALVWPLLLLPERVALDVQAQDEIKGSLIRHLRARVLTHAAGCREVNGADVALAGHGSARLVDEGAIRLDPGQGCPRP